LASAGCQGWNAVAVGMAIVLNTSPTIHRRLSKLD
jgi:hypothetical protein